MEERARVADLGAVAFGVLGIWLLVETVVYLASAGSAVLATDEVQWWFLLPLSIEAVLGLFFLAMRYPLAAALFPGERCLQAPPLVDLASLSFAVVGALLMADAVTQVAQGVAELALSRVVLSPEETAIYLEGGTERVQRWSSRMALVAKLGIGAFLFAGSSGLARTWHTLRRAGPGV